MSTRANEPAISNCAKCGETGIQALDVDTNKHGLVLSRAYYCYCFDGDCGAEGPRSQSSDESIRLWNDQQMEHQP